MAMLPFSGPNDPRLPNHFRPDARFHPNSPGGPGTEGQGFRYLGGEGGGGSGNNGGEGGGGGDGDPRGRGVEGLLSAFLPGQRNALAQQFSQGFGGGLKQWNGILGQAYQPMRIPQNPLGYPIPNRHDDKGDGKGDDKGDDHNGGGHDHGDNGYTSQLEGFNSHSSAPYLGMQSGQMAQASMMAPNIAQSQFPGAQSFNGSPGPAQPNVMLGQAPLSPQIMALLRQRLMMGGR